MSVTTYGSMTKLSRKVSWLKLVVTLVFCVILLEIMFNCKTSIFTTGKPGPEPCRFDDGYIKRLPQCLIIGAKKGGTRALLTFLRAHPDIVTAGQEIHYFDREENYSLGLEWYRNQMPPSWARQITMEKSPSYFIEDRVPERVKSMNQSIKLLLIVTDPIRRAISDYYQIYLLQLKKYSKPKSFEECALHPNGSVNIEYKVLQRSLYAVYMERWLRYFGKEQIHIINGEAFVRNPWTELSKVEKFLGIQHFLKEDNFYFNKTKGFYCFYKDKENTCMGDQKGRKHPVVDANTIDTLKQLFRKYNERFYKIVGVDFQWDYHM